eukprot:scaffold54096_cov33-Tisochrysis_lutea.AAC.3
MVRRRSGIDRITSAAVNSLALDNELSAKVGPYPSVHFGQLHPPAPEASLAWDGRQYNMR